MFTNEVYVVLHWQFLQNNEFANLKGLLKLVGATICKRCTGTIIFGEYRWIL